MAYDFMGGRGGGFGGRPSRVGNASVGTLEELKATAKTPEDLQRIHQTSDGRFYLPDQSEDVLGQLTGNFDLSNAQNAMTLHQIAQGDPTGRASRDLMISKAKNGFELGPMWSDVANLNRGRAATGYGRPNDPFEGFWGATQQAENMQAGLNNAFAQRGGQQPSTNIQPQGGGGGFSSAGYAGQGGVGAGMDPTFMKQRQRRIDDAVAGLGRAGGSTRMQSFSGGKF